LVVYDHIFLLCASLSFLLFLNTGLATDFDRLCMIARSVLVMKVKLVGLYVLS